jgi:rRNA maturation endonuclease Nob1
MEILYGILGFIALITFFAMNITLHNISVSVRNTERVISAWSKETGIGFIIKCKKCKKKFEGKLPKCPHCGDEKVYK